MAGALRHAGIDAGVERIAVELPLTEAALAAARHLAACPPLRSNIAEQIEPKITEKFHPFLTHDLLVAETGADAVDLQDFDTIMDGVARAIAHALEYQSTEVR
jgi:hypothetical protein